MATVTTHIGVSPTAVYAVLANGWHYSGWVAGTSHMQRGGGVMASSGKPAVSRERGVARCPK